MYMKIFIRKFLQTKKIIEIQQFLSKQFKPIEKMQMKILFANFALSYYRKASHTLFALHLRAT
jgi:hypothetical protein